MFGCGHLLLAGGSCELAGRQTDVPCSNLGVVVTIHAQEFGCGVIRQPSVNTLSEQLSMLVFEHAQALQFCFIPRYASKTYALGVNLVQGVPSAGDRANKRETKVL